MSRHQEEISESVHSFMRMTIRTIALFMAKGQNCGLEKRLADVQGK